MKILPASVTICRESDVLSVACTQTQDAFVQRMLQNKAEELGYTYMCIEVRLRRFAIKNKNEKLVKKLVEAVKSVAGDCEVKINRANIIVEAAEDEYIKALENVRRITVNGEHLNIVEA